MAFEFDSLIDRRRLKRRLTFWRSLAALALLMLLIVAAGRLDLAPGRPHIARITIDSVITEDHERESLLNRIAKTGDIKALIVRINSPGGTTAGSEALFEAIRQVAKHKPVVATIGTVGASGGYLAALAADYVVARETSITGSIGVLYESPQFSELLKKLGIGVDKVASGPLKGEPSPLHPMTDAVRAATQDVVDDTYEWFVKLVAERRKLDMDEARKLADGRIYTGHQAVTKSLVDALGGETTARAWLAETRGIPRNLSVVDMDASPGQRLLEQVTQTMFGKTLFPERLTLDGLLSLWHPE